MSTPSFEKAPWLEEELQKELEDKKSTKQEKETKTEEICKGFHEAEDAGFFKPGTKLEMEGTKLPRYFSGEISQKTNPEGHPIMKMQCPDGTEKDIIIHPGRYCNFKRSDSTKNSNIH